jgi:hypothetical protein
VALGHAVHLTWPVLSAILAIQVALGLLVGFVEGWSVGDTVYFTFVTGLTIGYGDIVPRQAVGRALTIGIGPSGFFLTGLIAGIAVYAMRIRRRHRRCPFIPGDFGRSQWQLLNKTTPVVGIRGRALAAGYDPHSLDP